MIVDNLILAVLYIVSGLIGLQFAIPPGFATLVWPPSGIATGFKSLKGISVWPGIFIGSLVVNLLKQESLSPVIILSCFVIAGASTIQIVTCVRLLRMVLGSPILTDLSLWFKFSAIVSVSCIIAASIATLTLLGLKLIPESYSLATWLNWYLGDVIGIFVFTPLITNWFVWPLPKITVGFIICGLCLIGFQFVALLTSAISLVIPLLCFGSYRFGRQWTSLFVPVLILTNIVYRVFTQQLDTASIIRLQIFFTTLVILGFGAAAIEAESKKRQLEMISQSESLYAEVKQLREKIIHMGRDYAD